jgi:hypothetical protein
VTFRSFCLPRNMMVDSDCSFAVLVDSGGGLGKRISGLRCVDMYAKPEVGATGNRGERVLCVAKGKATGEARWSRSRSSTVDKYCTHWKRATIRSRSTGSNWRSELARQPGMLTAEQQSDRRKSAWSDSTVHG